MRVLIVAAHPDDETIGASAVLGAPHETVVLHATDGAPRDPRWWPAGISDRDEYASVRALEAARALALAGATCIPLRFVDQEAACALRELVAVLADHIARLAPDLIITHAYEGGHPDHDAVAFAVARARRLVGRDVRLFEMALYHAAQGALVAGGFIDDRGSVRHELDQARLRRRRAMLDCFTSQRAVLAPFAELAHERYRVAPDYDFGRPPHDGALHYERAGFSITGEQWRALAGAM
jgi:LmbE family N-acetylglucosaminyl deacetylase